MQQHRFHAERVGDQAGMLAAGRAEALQCVLGDVIALLHRDLLDRVGHVLDRDADEAVGDLLRAARLAGVGRDPGRHLREGRVHRRVVERLVAAGSEDLREERRLQLADHHVGVGDCERPAAAVAFRAGVGAGAFRSGAEPAAVVDQDRAAAGGDGVDPHHRHPHAHARHLGLERALVVAGEVRHVGRGAAHVEADHLLEAGEPGGLGHADDAAGRARQYGVAAEEQLGRGEATRRRHEHDFWSCARRLPSVEPAAGRGARQRSCDLVDVAAQDRRQVGVGDGGVAAADDLDQRRDLVAGGHILEADAGCDRRGGLLVLGVGIGVHEREGDGFDAVGMGRLQIGGQAVAVEIGLDRAVRPHPLRGLDHARVQHLRLDDLLGEDVGPRLVADLDLVL